MKGMTIINNGFIKFMEANINSVYTRSIDNRNIDNTDYDVILLVGQAGDTRTFDRYAGPHRIATELRQDGFKVQIIYGLNFYPHNELIELLDTFISSTTLCIGISTTFLAYFSDTQYALPKPKPNIFPDNIKEICLYFKQKYKKLKIVMGGHRSKYKTPNSNNLIDAFFEGYSDLTFKNYIKNLKNNKIFLGQQHFIDVEGKNFDFKNSTIEYTVDDNIFQNESLTIELTRGCIFKCKFCAYPLLGRNAKDDSWIKKHDIIYKELMTNYERFGTTNYVFSDDTYNDSLTKIQYLYDIFSKLPFKINFATYLRLDLLYRYPEMIHILKESGLAAGFFGIETFHPYAKKTIGKGLDTNKLLQALENCNKIWSDEVVIRDSFIYGLPGETIDTMKNWTDDIIFGSGLFDKHGVVVRPLTLTNYPNVYQSEFEREVSKYGYTNGPKGYDWTNQVTNYYECSDLADETNRKLDSTPRPFPSFSIPVLLGYGFTKKELYYMNHVDPLVNEKINNMTAQRYYDYKKQFLHKNST